jgi:hypothetical protein
VTGEERPLVACESHSEESVDAAVQRVFHAEDEEEE